MRCHLVFTLHYMDLVGDFCWGPTCGLAELSSHIGEAQVSRNRGGLQELKEASRSGLMAVSRKLKFSVLQP